MAFQGEDLSVDVIAVQRPPAEAANAPHALWLFAAAMAVSLAVAAFGGLTLGILASTGRGVARTRWTEIVQAHGHLQLWGWVAVFVVALSFEFIIRFNQQAPVRAVFRLLVLGLIGVGSLVQASGQVIGHLDRPLAIAGSSLIVAGALGFAVLIFRVPAGRGPKGDLNLAYFRAGAAWLAVAAIGVLVSSAHMDSGVIPLEESRFWVEVFIRGFVLNVTLAVALHAFPGHLEVPAPSEGAQRSLFILLNLCLVGWAAGSGGFGLRGSDVLQRVGDIVFVGTLLFATVIFGLARSVVSLKRSSARYQFMVPIAWLGLISYALGLADQAALGRDLTLYETGAVRHMFLLGFMAPLMIAMAHIVLAHFGVGRVLWQNWLTAAFVLLVVAWPLRVLPPLLDRNVSSTTEGVMGVAGSLAALGLALAAIAAARNALAIASRARATVKAASA